MRRCIYSLLCVAAILFTGCPASNNNISSNTVQGNGDGWAEYAKGNAYLASGENEKAKQSFEIAAKVIAQGGASDSKTYMALGNSNFHIANHEKAQYYFGKILEDTPGDDDAICKMGKTKYHLEFYDEAIEYLQKCHQKHPQDGELMFLLASSTQKADRGVNKDILGLYQKSANAGNRDAMLQLGEIYRYNKYDERALTQYRKYIAQGGKLKRDAQEWFDAHQPQVASVDISIPQTNTNVSSSVNLEPIGQEETLLVCPFCGRLGEKGTSLCNFDGEPLEQLQ